MRVISYLLSVTRVSSLPLWPSCSDVGQAADAADVMQETDGAVLTAEEAREILRLRQDFTEQMVEGTAL
eukprot:768572-Hanusia_phi.AAC.2